MDVSLWESEILLSEVFLVKESCCKVIWPEVSRCRIKPFGWWVGGGFTLIELLVVIAIIALLLSILMPALRKAKAIARNVVCMSNMKQQNLIFTLYTQDNDGRYPIRYNSPGCVYIVDGTPAVTSDNVEQAWYALNPYVDDPMITICPAIASYNMDAGDIFKDPAVTWGVDPVTGKPVFGGWASIDTDPGRIHIGFNWFFNIDSSPATSVTYFNGTRPWPNRQVEANSSTALVTHAMIFSPSAQRYEDWGHEASSKGRIFSTDPGYVADDVNVLTSVKAPVAYGDGSVISVPKSRFRKRAEVNGDTFYY